MANKTITQLDTAQSLNDNMVIAVQDTNTTYKTTLADVKAYCGAAPAGDKYKVGDRVKDDSNNDVGTVSSIFTDGNGQRYAVVCLDAVNRLASGTYMSSAGFIANIPQYSDQRIWSAPETATTNTTEILATATSNGFTSSACSHCRSKSFTINGNIYEGQLPNLNELSQIFIQRTVINNQDPTANSYSSLIIPYNKDTWSSNQFNYDNYAWAIGVKGYAYSDNMGSNGQAFKYNGKFVIPVLEIPLED